MKGGLGLHPRTPNTATWLASFPHSQKRDQNTKVSLAPANQTLVPSYRGEPLLVVFLTLPEVWNGHPSRLRGITVTNHALLAGERLE
jgi:hypothetical protein